MPVKLIIILLFFLPVAWQASGQFTIKKEQSQDIQDLQFSRQRPTVELENAFYDAAALKAEKRRLRREHNMVEFNSSLETSLQQFENWTGSGNNNFYVLANLFFRHQYKREKFFLDYRIDATYGMNFIDEAFFKNKDEFKVSAQMGWTMHRNWSYSATANYRSQFAPGYKSRTERLLVSRFMSPGYFDIAVGFTYKNIENPFKVTLSPVGGNIVTVLDPVISELGKYGVEAGRSVEGKVGPSADIFFDKTFGAKKRYSYRSNLYVFLPYSDLGDPLVRWENTVEIRISKHISTRLYGQLYYRRSESTALQYQYAFMVGLKYAFKNK